MRERTVTRQVHLLSIIQQFTNRPVLVHQWHAALFVELEFPKARYPTNAPTATASIIQPLYVIKRSLDDISHDRVASMTQGTLTL